MKSRCTVCNHHLIDDINLAILSGDYTLDELSQKFGPSRSAFHRHGRHLENKMRRTLERLENNRKQVSLLKLSAFLDHVQARVEAAAADDDTDRVYKGSHIGCRLIHQINKMDVPLEPDTAYRLLSSPGLVASDSLLPAGPHIIADLQQALRDQTLAPCPLPASDEDEKAAENQAADQPVPKKDLPHLATTQESKKLRRQRAKLARKNQRLLRQKLRHQKHLLQEKNLFQNFGAVREMYPQGGEAQAPPALTNPSSLIPDPCRSNPEPETVCDTAPEASSTAKVPKPERDKSATKAKRQRRLHRKMLQNQIYISKAKKLLQNFTLGLEKPPPGGEAQTPPVTLDIATTLANDLFAASESPENVRLEIAAASPQDDPLRELFLENRENSRSGNIFPKNPEVWQETAAPPHLTDSSCLISNPCSSTSELETALPETGNQEPEPNPDPSSLIPFPCPEDETARRADELFEISHGYKRNNPPPIPNRRREEDFRSTSIFGVPRKIFG
jgi:hypothetical protein